MFLKCSLLCRNVLAAATPYFHAMFTSGLIESEYEGRWIRGVGGAGKNKQRQRLVLQGIQQKTLEVSHLLWSLATTENHNFEWK